MGYYENLVKSKTEKQTPNFVSPKSKDYYSNLLREKYNYNPAQPRDSDGQWTAGGATKKKEESKKTEKSEKQHMPLKEFLGQEFKGYKGQDAVNKLLIEKTGHIKSAFYRQDIGDIDLVWGNEEEGLAHIIKRREEEKHYDTKEIIDNLTDIIEKGQLSKNKEGKYEIWHDKKMVIIRPDYYGAEVRWVLTGFKQRKPNKN